VRTLFRNIYLMGQGARGVPLASLAAGKAGAIPVKPFIEEYL
jgi:hypothetical protein